MRTCTGASRHQYTTVFSDGGGLKPESPVRIAGIEVGSVRAVTLTPDNKVEVVFDVLDEYADRLRQDPPDGSCSKKSRSSMMDSDEEKQAADAAHDDGLWILQEPVLFQGHENENRGEYENAQPEPVGKHRPSSCVIGGTIG